MAELPSLSQALERSLPHADEAERAVLGAVFVDNDVLNVIQDSLEPEDFYKPAHAEMYRGMCAIAELGEPVDAITLQAELKRRDQLDRVGGPQSVVMLLTEVPSAANATHYVNIVKTLSSVRRLIRAGQEIATRGLGDFGDLDAFVSDAESRIAEIAKTSGGATYALLAEILGEVIQNIERRYERKGEPNAHITGVALGFRKLDWKTGGLQPGALTVVAARPGMGKSTFAQNIALNVALDVTRFGKRVPTILFTLEMGKEELGERFLSMQSRVPLQKLRTGNLTDSEIRAVVAGQQVLAEAPVRIDDTAAITVAQISARCKRLRAEGQLGLVIVDYLQLLSGARGGWSENRQQEISSISRGLKALAMNLQVPVVALSQLSRNVERREDKRPQLSDLRESGAIEQDADLILFLHVDPEDETSDVVEVIIGKNRNGPTGKFPLYWGRECFFFRDVAEEIDPDDYGAEASAAGGRDVGSGYHADDGEPPAF